MQRICVLALTLLLLTSTGASAQDKTKRPYEINVILGLSGYGAFIAQGQSGAFRALEKYVNDTGGIRGQPIHFNLLDSQSSPQVDIQLTSTVLAKKPSFVIDGGPAAACHAASVLYASGPVMYCLSPGFFPSRGGYAFGAGIESRDGMSVVVRYLRLRGFKRLGIITMTDIAGQEADAALKSLLADQQNETMKVVAWEHFGPSDISVNAQMANIKAARPDVVVGWATGTPFGTLLQGYKDLGITLPFVTTDANEHASQMQQYKSDMPRELIMYSNMWPAGASLPNGPLKAAIDSYRLSMSAVGSDFMDNSSAETWDAGLVLVNALRALGTTATPEQIRDYIAGLHDYYGPSGRFDFRVGNQRGLDESSAIMVRWDVARRSWQPISAPKGIPLR